VHDQGNVCARAVHWSSPGLFENDEGGGEDGAAGAATRPGGGEGGGRYTVFLVTLFCPFFFRSLLISISPALFLLFESLSFCLFLSFFPFSSSGQAGRGRGSRREPLADCSRAQRTARERTVYNIVMIQ